MPQTKEDGNQPHPAQIRAYSLTRAIGLIAQRASENPNTTPEQSTDIAGQALFVQFLIFRGPTALAREELLKFIKAANALTPPNQQ